MNRFGFVLVGTLQALALWAPQSAEEKPKPDLTRVLSIESAGNRLELNFEPKYFVEITTDRAIRNSDSFTRGFGAFPFDTITTSGATELRLKTDDGTAMTIKFEAATITLPKWRQIDFSADKVNEGRGSTVLTGAVRITIPPTQKQEPAWAEALRAPTKETAQKAFGWTHQDPFIQGLRAPTKENAQASPGPLLVIVQTTEDGSLRELIVREDEDEVTIKTLKALSRYLRRVRLDKESPDVVAIQVDPNTKYLIATDVVGACTKAGYQKIQFATPQPPQRKP